VVLGQRSQMFIRLNGFPIGQPGFYTIQTWVEDGQALVVGPIEFKLELRVVVNEVQSPQPTK
jgi:hypothetical protein